MSTKTVVTADDHGALCLSKRLACFRKWLIDEAKCVVHPSISIVNGEATDGTKNAPVLVYGRAKDSVSNPASSTALSSSTGVSSNSNVSSNSGTRCGIIDTEEEQILWDKTVGCQVRTVREVKKDDVLLEIPRSSMISPDIVASSDAGMAIFQCCESGVESPSADPWESLCGLTEAVEFHKAKLRIQSGTQLLVNILRERKRAEDALSKACREDASQISEFQKAPRGSVSSRAPFIAFLLQQRFGRGDNVEDYPLVQSESNMKKIQPRISSGTIPKTFAPYVIAFPSAFSLPICWKRNELALLSGCQGGFNLLVEVAAHTLVLSNDLIQLIKAGLLHRFPNVFPKGSISWDSWVWASAAWTSRAFPVNWYLKEGESIQDIMRDNSYPITAAAENVWEDLGVMIPLVDMMNHESDSGQIMWESGTNSNTSGGEKDEIKNGTCLLISQKRIKKGSQICNCYGSKGNQELIYQYGFAQIANPKDETTMSWALGDSVGGVHPAPEFAHLCHPELQNGERESQDVSDYVYESTDQNEINSWWTEERLKLLKLETMVNDASIEKLLNGKKLSAPVSVAGSYHPTLLAAAVVATMPKENLKKLTVCSDSNTERNPVVRLSKRHQDLLRCHLEFFYKRKQEKLLSNLSHGLKAHFNNVQLWTRASDGGLNYQGGSDGKIGWQRFFDTYAYNGAMEVEKRYYAIGADSCVLALYDGILRSIQASIQGTSETFESILTQLVDLGFVISDEKDEGTGEVTETEAFAEDAKCEANTLLAGKDLSKEASNSDIAKTATAVACDETPLSIAECATLSTSIADEEGKQETKSKSTNGTTNLDSKKRDRASGEKGSKKSGGNSEGGRSRKRNRSKGNSNNDQHRPAAIKLHIGNLSYATLPSALFDYFSRTYGSGNILECHIPTERATGKSRGFGFVTMPEDLALRVLDSDRKHEIQGRLLKIARSNTAGSGKTSQTAATVTSSDRCLSCGYRPKYCTCPMPKLPCAGIPGNALLGAGRMPVGIPVIPPPPHVPLPIHPHYDEYPMFDAYGHRLPMGTERDPLWSRSHGHDLSRSLSPSRRFDRHSRRERDNRHDRDYRRSSYSPSRSRSYDRDDKTRRRRKRSRSRSRDRHGSRSSSSDSDRDSRRRRSSRSSRQDYVASKQRSDDSDSAGARGSRRRASSREERRERKRSKSNSRSPSRSRHGVNRSRSHSDSQSGGSRSHRKSGEQSQSTRGRR